MTTPKPVEELSLDLAIQRQALEIELELQSRDLHRTNLAAPMVRTTAGRGNEPAAGAAVSFSPNQNAAAYHQVHAYPKGRW